ncbi:hypothetical protein HBB16_17590 [Pseudonocardia sp. MCCB 268]|nr:hypothetical protein [Pseudonocardia cytotoxica]
MHATYVLSTSRHRQGLTFPHQALHSPCALNGIKESIFGVEAPGALRSSWAGQDGWEHGGEDGCRVPGVRRDRDRGPATTAEPNALPIHQPGPRRRVRRRPRRPGELLDGCWACSARSAFTRFRTRILAAAIRGRLPAYVDISDDWEPTLDALELDARPATGSPP